MKTLLGMGTNAIRQIGTQVLNKATDFLFSKGSGDARKAAEMQRILNEEAAKTNYEYGEKAADNAMIRQMRMYERSYKDQSYSAMRKQMEDAGLSVGLMYGNGASGGGAGSTSGAPQAETGGAAAGNAAEMVGLALQKQRVENETMVARSQAALNEAQASKLDTDREDTNATRNARIEDYLSSIGLKKKQAAKIYQEGRAQWIQNIKTEFLMEHTREELENSLNEMGVFKDETGEYGTTVLNYAAEWTERELNELYKIVNEGAQARSAALLANKQRRAIAEEIAIAWKNADANEMKAKAMKLAAEFETGEFTNWKNVLEVIIGLLGGAAKIAGATKGSASGW